MPQKLTPKHLVEIYGMSRLKTAWKVLVAGTMVALAGPVTAAPITFGSAVNIGNNLNSLNQPGRVVYAVNFGPQTAANQSPQLNNTGSPTGNILLSSTVAGITFRPVNLAISQGGANATVATGTGNALNTTFVVNDTDSARFGPNGTGNNANTTNTDFDDILDSNVFKNTGNRDFDVVLNGLRSGAMYTVQLFAIRNAAANVTYQSVDGGVLSGTASGLLQVNTPGGRYVMGSFTANATTQTIRALSANTAYLSALIVRQVPELTVAQSMASMSIFGLIALLAWDRRKIVSAV